jgi:predicted SnoaL-like aldol condensation-catalyzing enzyme
MLIGIAALLTLSAGAYAAEPVVPAKDQAALLKSDDPQLAANKKLVYDMWRAFLVAHHMDAADQYLAPEYHQHNPNAVTGLEGVKAYFKALNQAPTAIPDEIPGLVSIVAERDLVVMSFVRNYKDKEGNPYTTTWFDMFRIKDGKIVEHWDSALKQ